MIKLDYTPVSQEFADYVRVLCPCDAHMLVSMVGVWSDVLDFSNKFMSTVTTHNRVVRVFTYQGVTHWTLETWTHDNGYHCTLSILSKTEFLSLIHS